MPVYQLTEEFIFPSPEMSEPDGLLAIEGDLSIDRLLLAYANGIFPWYDEDSPIMWWSPGPRMVLYPDKLKVSKSLAQSIRNKGFSVAFDTNFVGVIAQCAKAHRPDQDGTWITGEMQEAYLGLHHEGFAHSVEIYHEKTLVGGLYGVSLGRVFFGESMFHIKRDASKVALYYLAMKLKAWDFDLIDAQQNTGHIRSMGGELMEKSVFLNILKKSLKVPTIRGKWSL